MDDEIITTTSDEERRFREIAAESGFVHIGELVRGELARLEAELNVEVDEAAAA